MPRIPYNGDCCSPEQVNFDSPERVNIASSNWVNSNHADAHVAAAPGHAEKREFQTARVPKQRKPRSTGHERAHAPAGLRRPACSVNSSSERGRTTLDLRTATEPAALRQASMRHERDERGDPCSDLPCGSHNQARRNNEG